MVIVIGCGIHPLSGAWEIDLIVRFRLCLQPCSCYFLQENASRIAQFGFEQPCSHCWVTLLQRLLMQSVLPRIGKGLDQRALIYDAKQSDKNLLPARPPVLT